MRPVIDWKECIKDSPSFRAALEDAEDDMDSLEVHLEKLLKHCDWMHEAGKVFYSANSAFVSSVRDLMTHFNDDCFVLEALGRFSQTLSDWQNFHNTMLEQCNQCFTQNINNFIKTDIRRVKESRKQFRKFADEMDGALNRNAQAPRSKPDDCDEISSQLDTARHNFMQTSLQHVLEINLMQLRKRLDLLNAMFSYIQTQSKFVRQGFELFTNLEPYNHKLKSELDELYRKATTEKRHMTEKHKALLSGDLSLLGLGNNDQSLSSEVKMEGYLFKRTSNAFKTWVRRWFVVENNQLLYCSRQRSKESTTVLEKDLRLCNVKPCYDTDRRFCFQIISPLRCHVLQADSDADCQKWVTAIQDGASKAYSKSIVPNLTESKPEEALIPRRFSAPSASPKSSKEPEQAPSAQSRHVPTILSVMGNTACCDCGLKDPRWASINFGITLCIECSGIHRSFGVHKSKVRSLTLDAWDEDHIGLMTRLGNTLVNRVFEAVVDRSVQRAHPGCSREVREVWITAKYLQRAFVRPGVSAPHLASPPGSTSRSGRNFAVLSSSPSFADVHHLSCDQATVIKQVASQDSGLGGSGDVILCASSVSDHNSSLGLEDTHSAISDLELDTDVSVSTSDDIPKPCVNTMLCRAALAGNIPEMLQALALGAVPNWNCSAEEGKTALIRAIESGDVLAMEFLLLNGAKTDVADDFGRTPLHHAAALRRTTHVYQLIKRNANQRLKDVNGEDALDIAVKNTDANIVTLLRLARLNDEMKESDALYDIQDEMFSEVFKDFGNLRNIPEDQEDRL